MICFAVHQLCFVIEIYIGISACTKYDWYNKSYFWDKREEFKWKNQVEQSGVAYRIREVGAGLPLENNDYPEYGL